VNGNMRANNKFRNVVYPTDLGDHNAARSRLSPALRTYWGILLGALCLGTWDLLFVRIYWNAEGVNLVRVLQSMASGIYGRASRTGGVKTAIVGAVCHYFIALCMVLAYFLVSQRLGLLLRRPISLGLAYGVFLYFFMNLVVLPISAIGHPSFGDHKWMAWSIGMHALFGLLCALTARFARRVSQQRSTSEPGSD
jgi:hypothetical protein